MPLPERIPRARPDAGQHAGHLIAHRRHGSVATFDDVVNEIWQYGRDHVIQVMFHLAVPVGTYYVSIGEVPPSYYLFDVGSADRFVHGHVRAAMDGDEVLATRLLNDFRNSSTEEFERAIRLLAQDASSCLYIIEFLDECELLTSGS